VRGGAPLMIDWPADGPSLTGRQETSTLRSPRAGHPERSMRCRMRASVLVLLVTDVAGLSFKDIVVYGMLAQEWDGAAAVTANAE